MFKLVKCPICWKDGNYKNVFTFFHSLWTHGYYYGNHSRFMKIMALIVESNVWPRYFIRTLKLDIYVSEHLNSFLQGNFFTKEYETVALLPSFVFGVLLTTPSKMFINSKKPDTRRTVLKQCLFVWIKCRTIYNVMLWWIWRSDY